MKSDFIIVGAGIAGVSLAVRLEEAGKKVVLIADPNQKMASKVAAGLMNPIVFKRVSLSWRTKECLDEAQLFYRSLEQKFNSEFFVSNDLLRIHGGDDERKTWIEKSKEQEYKNYLGEQVDLKNYPFLKAPFGVSLIKGAGFIKSEVFVDSARQYFKSKEMLIEERFKHDLLQVKPNGITYREYTADKLIFCEGASAERTGLFTELLFKIAKGEVLTIHADGLPEHIYNGKVYAVPLGDSKFKVGSTYAWDQEDEEPTEEGKAEIIEKLKGFLNHPFEVLEHTAGFRPTVKDRRPLLGMHPILSSVGVFNGLGTKGYLLAPWLSRIMANHLLYNSELPDEVKLTRFKKFKLKALAAE